MNYEQDELDRQLVLLAHDDSVPSDLLRVRILNSALAAWEYSTPLEGGESALSDASQPIVRLVPDEPYDSEDECRRRNRLISEDLSRRHTTRRLMMMMRKKSVRYGAIAVVASFVMLGGFTIWPGGAGSESENGRWWLGPPAAWAGVLDPALRQAVANGVTCRERILIVDATGSSHESGTVTTCYISNDSYRRDIYDGEILHEIQWYTPEADEMIQTSVRFDSGNFSVCRHGGSFGRQNPIDRLRFYVHLLDQADRQLAPEMIDGHLCAAFELRASLYGDNPDTWIDQIWFDVNTRLPVRLEHHGRPVTGDSLKTSTQICDEFDYDARLPPDTFTPWIPSGFVEVQTED